MLDDGQIAIEYDKDYYEQLPSDKWKTDRKYLILDYSLKKDGIVLSNKGADAVFAKEIKLVLSADSKLVLTGDSYVTSLESQQPAT